MTTLPRVKYGNLSPSVRAEIKQTGQWIPGVNIAGYIRWNCPDGVWTGDSCGCSDDRCGGGYHHDGEGEPCGCLDVLLGQYVRHLNGDHRACLDRCAGGVDAMTGGTR